MASPAPRKRKIEYPHIERLILHFGGPEKLSLALKRRNFPPITESGIEKWRRRGTIPMQRLIDLQELGRMEKKPISIGIYLRQFAASKAA